MNNSSDTDLPFSMFATVKGLTPEALSLIHICLFFKLEPTRQNVMKAIRDAVLNNGRSILDFPEAWGEDLMDCLLYTSRCV